MSEQEKKSGNKEQIFDAFTPIILYFILNSFFLAFLWIQLESVVLYLSLSLLYQFIALQLLSLGLGSYLLTINFYKTRQENTQEIDDLFKGESNELTGSNVIEFYRLHKKYIIKGDHLFEKQNLSIFKKKIGYSIFSSVFLLFLIIYYNEIYIIISTQRLILDLTLIFIVGSLIIYKLLSDIKQIKNHSDLLLHVNSISFNEKMQKSGLNLHSSPKTRAQLHLIEFLELANFLQRYFQNYKKKRNYSYLCIGLVFSLAILLRFYKNSNPLFEFIGMCLGIFCVLAIGIITGKYEMSKKIIQYSDLALGNCFFTV